MDDRSVVETLAGEGGFLVAMKPGAVHLCVATISPACAEELARLHRDHGTRYVSGPVIGRPDAAAAGQLATYLGGDPEAIKSVRPVCESYARMVVEISPRPSVANMLPCGLRFDHRIVDGAPVGRFVQALTDLLAHPELMLL